MTHDALALAGSPGQSAVLANEVFPASSGPTEERFNLRAVFTRGLANDLSPQQYFEAAYLPSLLASQTFRRFVTSADSHGFNPTTGRLEVVRAGERTEFRAFPLAEQTTIGEIRVGWLARPLRGSDEGACYRPREPWEEAVLSIIQRRMCAGGLDLISHKPLSTGVFVCDDVASPLDPGAYTDAECAVHGVVGLAAELAPPGFTLLRVGKAEDYKLRWLLVEDTVGVTDLTRSTLRNPLDPTSSRGTAGGEQRLLGMYDLIWEHVARRAELFDKPLCAVGALAERCGLPYEISTVGRHGRVTPYVAVTARFENGEDRALITAVEPQPSDESSRARISVGLTPNHPLSDAWERSRRGVF